MAAYAYSAINIDGMEAVGEIHAPTIEAAREQLRIRGLLAQGVRELPASGDDSLRTFFKKIKSRSLQVFSRQFATMIEAGLNVVAALVILEEQTDDLYLAAVISELRADVEGGLLLSQAMARHPKIFSTLYVAMVEAGEASGMLGEVLDRVAFQIEKEAKIRRRVKGAMVYPTVVFAFATLVLTAMLTQWVVAASDLLRARWFIIFPLLIGAILAIRRYKRTESGRQAWDRLKLRIPMRIGDVVLKVTMARLSRTLATLVAAGVDIIKALEIAGATAGNWVVETALADVRT